MGERANTGKDQPDFWNLGKGSGRVRFLKLLKRTRLDSRWNRNKLHSKGARGRDHHDLKEALSISVEATNEGNFIDYHLTQKNVSKERLDFTCLSIWRAARLSWPSLVEFEEQQLPYLCWKKPRRQSRHSCRLVCYFWADRQRRCHHHDDGASKEL